MLLVGDRNLLVGNQDLLIGAVEARGFASRQLGFSLRIQPPVRSSLPRPPASVSRSFASVVSGAETRDSPNTDSMASQLAKQMSRFCQPCSVILFVLF
jgi:hypothetical protein